MLSVYIMSQTKKCNYILHIFHEVASGGGGGRGGTVDLPLTAASRRGSFSGLGRFPRIPRKLDLGA